MKKLLILSLLMWGVAGAQTTGYLRYDSVRMEKVGGNSELILLNASRNVTGGVLTNIGNGRTAFVTPGGGTGGSGISKVIAQYGLVQINDSTFRVDTSFIIGVTTAWRLQKIRDSLGALIDTKMPAGNYITALTGDGTATGPGSAVLTLANTGVAPGPYSNPNVTVNAKGLVTSIASGPAVPAQFNPVAGTGISLTGSYPNITFSSIDQTKARNGLTLFGDTMRLGGRLDKITYLTVPSAKNALSDSYNKALIVSNLSSDSSYFDTAHFVQGTYEPSVLYVQQRYKQAWGDTVAKQYGGVIRTDHDYFYDSTQASNQYTAGGKSIILPNSGIYANNFLAFPRDTVLVQNGRDGTHGSIIKADLNFGETWGYNRHDTSTVPGLGQVGISSNADFQRRIDDTRRRQWSGLGYSNFMSMYKFYQSSISPTTQELGSHIDTMTQYNALGSMYQNLSTGGATKAKILAVSKLGMLRGYNVQPLWLPFNEVETGMAFRNAGDSDYNWFAGRTRMGGTEPSRFNNILPYKLEVFQTSRFDTLRVGVTDGLTQTRPGLSVTAGNYTVNAISPVGQFANLNFYAKDTALRQGVVGYQMSSSRDSRNIQIVNGDNYDYTEYAVNGAGYGIELRTGPFAANVTKMWRNGNVSIGGGTYKDRFKLSVLGTTLLVDTLVLGYNYLPGSADTTLNKPLWINAANQVVRGYHIGAGSGGGGGGGITTLNTLTGSTQTFALGSTGTTPNIVSSGTSHTFHFPLAGSGVTSGMVSNGTQTFYGAKTFNTIPAAFGLTSSNTDMILKQTGDAFGESGLILQNKAGAAGGTFYNNGLDLVDMQFLASSTAAYNFRYEHRSSEFKNATNTGGEFQFMSAGGTIVNQAFGNGGGYFAGSLGVGIGNTRSTLDVQGSVGLAYVAKTANYSITSSDFTVDATTGTFHHDITNSSRGKG
jgi:hypothetical protein